MSNGGFEYLQKKYLPERKRYWSNHIGQSREEGIFEIKHGLFNPPANLHCQFDWSDWILLCIVHVPQTSNVQFQNPFSLAFTFIIRARYIFFKESIWSLHLTIFIVHSLQFTCSLFFQSLIPYLSPHFYQIRSCYCEISSLNTLSNCYLQVLRTTYFSSLVNRIQVLASSGNQHCGYNY